jgi:hypothetical protein
MISKLLSVRSALVIILFLWITMVTYRSCSQTSEIISAVGGLPSSVTDYLSPQPVLPTVKVYAKPQHVQAVSLPVKVLTPASEDAGTVTAVPIQSAPSQESVQMAVYPIPRLSLGFSSTVSKTPTLNAQVSARIADTSLWATIDVSSPVTEIKPQVMVGVRYEW